MQMISGGRDAPSNRTAAYLCRTLVSRFGALGVRTSDGRRATKLAIATVALAAGFLTAPAVAPSALGGLLGLDAATAEPGDPSTYGGSWGDDSEASDTTADAATSDTATNASDTATDAESADTSETDGVDGADDGDDVDGPTGFEGSPEVGPAHAEAVHTGADTYDGGDAGDDTTSNTTGFENSPEIGPAHAEAVNTGAPTYGGTATAPQTPEGTQFSLGASLLGPFGGEVRAYIDDDWDRVQLTSMGGLYIGFKGSVEQANPAQPGLSWEESMGAIVGPGSVHGSFKVEDQGVATVGIRAGLGGSSYAVDAQIAPEVEVSEPRIGQRAPTPTGVGVNATAGFSYTTEYDLSGVVGPVSDAWDSYVDTWNDLQEAVHGTRPDGPARRDGSR